MVATACKIIPVTLVLNHLGEESDEDMKQTNALISQIKKSKIQTVVSNDGIGSYEFWGFPGFDKGHDFLEIEDCDVFEITLKVNKGIPKKYNEKVIIELLEEYLDDVRNRSVSYMDEDVVTGDAQLKFDEACIKDNVFTCKIYWELVD